MGKGRRRGRGGTRESGRPRPPPVAALAAALAFLPPAAPGAEPFDDRVARKLTAYQGTVRDRFEAADEVVCQAAEGGPGAPVLRRFDGQTVLSWRAPPGYAILPGTVAVEVLASDGGRHEPPEVAEGSVRVTLRCTGKGPGEGQSLHRARVAGEIAMPASGETMAEFAQDCRRCGERGCP